MHLLRAVMGLRLGSMLCRPGYFDVYTRPPQWLMQAFRARMTSCLQAPLLALQVTRLASAHDSAASCQQSCHSCMQLRVC